jgi:hypothetical protein
VVMMRRLSVSGVYVVVWFLPSVVAMRLPTAS